MTTVDDRIEVDRPISTVYNQWTQFEKFPHFMAGVESVEQLDDVRLHWKASIGGVTREWQARILQQEPDRIISWENVSGPANRGIMSFRPIGTDRTEVSLHLEFEPEGWRSRRATSSASSVGGPRATSSASRSSSRSAAARPAAGAARWTVA